VTRIARVDPWAPPVALMAVIFFLSSQPDLDSGLGVFDLIGRKIVHAAEYALLCLLWWRALRTITPSARAALIAVCICVVYSATDEYHQTFVKGRHGSPIDVAIDGAGAGAMALLLRRRARAGAQR
jgi:VanZ family protein